MEIGDSSLDVLRERAGVHDRSGAWPELDLVLLGEIGAMDWVRRLDALALHLLYERLASASLSTALVLTQRDSAVSLALASANEALKRELVESSDFITVGIAQLTTSRQGGAPALLATKIDGGYRLDGVIPWCTGAAKAKHVVAGAALETGEQILFALPMDLPGVKVSEPMELVALRSSWTSEIVCRGVELNDHWLLAGPMANVLSIRKKQLPLGQAFLALGHARGILHLIHKHHSARANALHQRLNKQLNDLHEQVIACCQSGAQSESVPQVRSAVTDLALRAAHASVTLYKGSALLETHPAQRLAREALFLLVWSCPDKVIECTVELLTQERE